MQRFGIRPTHERRPRYVRLGMRQSYRVSLGEAHRVVQARGGECDWSCSCAMEQLPHIGASHLRKSSSRLDRIVVFLSNSAQDGMLEVLIVGLSLICLSWRNLIVDLFVEAD